MEIKGQAAIVTGGGSGLGAATARALAAAGARVAVVDINEKAAAEMAADIKGVAIACDVADAARPSASSARTGRCRLPTTSASSAST
jgi:NAD(P)-dependent dehydrogenase (short-subunit alcohol dehydrogenase family)